MMCPSNIHFCFIILSLHHIQYIYGQLSPGNHDERVKYAQCKLKDADLKNIMSQKGDKGDRGLDGKGGQKGDRGEQGLQGITIRGPQGEPGVCAPSDIEENPGFGTESHPLKVVCKTGAPEENGEFYIKPNSAADIFKVRCSEGKTCVLSKNSTKLQLKKEKHWLISNNNLLLQDIYGLNLAQLLWLQQSSQYVKQVIRLHCLNTAPVPEDVNLFLKLLTWNDVIIGPEPSVTTPLFYNLKHDGCKNAPKDVWNFADIEIISEIPNRLPIVDFQFKDVRDSSQIIVENLELCFQ